MITERCPHCGAFCCRGDSGIILNHRVNRYTRHVCPDCNDGYVPAPEPTWSVEDERKAAVTWLRSWISQMEGADGYAYEHAANAIERGEHRREEEP